MPLPPGLTIFYPSVYMLRKKETISYALLTPIPALLMKRLFTFLLLLVCLPGFSQEELPSYNEIIEVSGASRQDLYGRAQAWLEHLNYQISFDNPESGFISVGGEMPVPEPGTGQPARSQLIYVLTFIVEEEKYWFEFTPFYDEVQPVAGPARAEKQEAAATPARPTPERYQALDAHVRAEIEDLKRAMLAATEAPAGGVMGNTGRY